MTVLDAALALHGAGVRPIPIARGTKFPTSGWDGSSAVMPDESVVRDQFKNGVWIGAQSGAVSGNLECIDFDDPECFEPWKQLVDAYGLGAVFAQCYVQQTPRGGYHVVFRYDGHVPGNQKLASKYDDSGKKKVRIETRGDGGYFLVYPSSGYKTVQGKWSKLPSVSASARSRFMEAAKTFDRCPKRPYVTQGTGVSKPGSDFDAKTAWDDILVPHGWRCSHERNGERYWTRPGKKDGISATTGYAGTDLLYVFSSNASPFEPEATYSKFAAFAFLEHGADFTAAARALASKGYGDQTPMTKTMTKTTAKPGVIVPDDTERPRQRWVTLDEVQERKTDWLMEPYIPLGEITLVAGDPGVGKSSFLQAVSTAVTLGSEVCGASFPQGSVVFLSAEQSVSRITKPRFRQMGADMKLIMTPDDESGDEIQPFVLDQSGIAELREVVVGSDVRLIVVDTVTAYIEGQRDFNTANSVREWMRRLAGIARDQQCALCLIAHFNKNTNAKPLYRIGGSIDFVGASRSVLLIGHDAENENVKVVAHEKTNVGRKGRSITYVIDPDTGEFGWQGFSELGSEELFVAPQTKEAARNKKACADWLESLLKDGPVDSTTILAAAKENGFSRNTVFEAKKAIGAAAERDKFGENGKWQWYMPKENVGKRWWND